MDATPENQEKKPDSVENGAGAQSSEKESEKASTKGANEAYGAPKNGGQSDEETVFGVSTKKEDWSKVDDSTFQTKDGDTWSLVDNQAGGSLLYGQNDWQTLFSWSTEERNGSKVAKSESTDSWLSSLGFDNIFGSSDK